MFKTKKLQLLAKIRLKKKLQRVKFKDTVFCPQKRTKLVSNLRFMSPRKPNSANRKIFWSAFGNPFYSRDFVYLQGEGFKTIYRNRNQGLVMHNWVLARNGLTKDLRGLKYKIIHGAQVRKFKFFGLSYKRAARSKYVTALSPDKKKKRQAENRSNKKKNKNFFRQHRMPTNKFYH